ERASDEDGKKPVWLGSSLAGLTSMLKQIITPCSLMVETTNTTEVAGSHSAMKMMELTKHNKSSLVIETMEAITKVHSRTWFKDYNNIKQKFALYTMPEGKQRTQRKGPQVER
ncbi:unnamed protein product, partial [Sphenostylis stenocarpa]